MAQLSLTLREYSIQFIIWKPIEYSVCHRLLQNDFSRIYPLTGMFWRHPTSECIVSDLNGPVVEYSPYERAFSVSHTSKLFVSEAPRFECFEPKKTDAHNQNPLAYYSNYWYFCSLSFLNSSSIFRKKYGRVNLRNTFLNDFKFTAYVTLQNLWFVSYDPDHTSKLLDKKIIYISRKPIWSIDMKSLVCSTPNLGAFTSIFSF